MKCDFCGNEFELKAENRYLSREPDGLSNCMKGGGDVYDSFDCPECGCQHRVNLRYPPFEYKPKNSQETENND